MSLVLKNATLITAADIFRADILIEGEQIRAIGQGLNASQALDCQGKMITPGGVDAPYALRSAHARHSFLG